MKFVLSVVLCLSFLLIHGQDTLLDDYTGMKDYEITKLVNKNGFVSRSGFSVKKGDELKLGNGTLPNKSFGFIYQSPIGYATESSIDGSKKKGLPSGFANKKVFVKKFNTTGSKRTGYNIVAVVGAGDYVNYWVEIDQAIEAGEIIIPEPYASRLEVNKSKEAIIIQQSKISVADELKKLKKLYDEGVLTKEEYEAQKKKLLDQ